MPNQESPFSVGPTVFQWLIERGQPEGQVPTVWLEHSLEHLARDKHWTTNAREAAMFPSRETAEAYIREHFTSTVTSQNPVAATARAVEHGFMTEGEND